jgi:cytochrome P450
MESQGASQRDMVQQAMHLLVAGMDTSAAALGWIMAMLAARPEVYERLRKEILAVFGREEEARSADCFTLETLKGCTYLQWCLNETLRLFPAGSSMCARRCVIPCFLWVGDLMGWDLWRLRRVVECNWGRT